VKGKRKRGEEGRPLAGLRREREGVSWASWVAREGGGKRPAWAWAASEKERGKMKKKSGPCPTRKRERKRNAFKCI
jgi:hypothetical protein